MDESSQAYIDQLSEAGSYDSSGSFTLSVKAALQKLGAFQLPRASAWVLKVVQAAVCWEASAIEVKQRRYVTTFLFNGQQEFSVDDLHIALLQPTPSGPAPARNMAVALRAVGFGGQRRFLVKVTSAATCHTLGWDGETLYTNSVPADPVEWCEIELSVDFALEEKKHSSAGSARRASDEAEELVRASVCPISLKLDGRQIGNLRPPEPYRESAKVAQMALAWSPPPRADRPGLRLPAGLDLSEPWFSVTNRLTDHRVFLIDGDQHLRSAEFLLRISYHYSYTWNVMANRYDLADAERESSWMYWVMDGVVINSVRLPGRPLRTRLDLFVSAAGLKTDISGLSVDTASPEAKERAEAAWGFAMTVGNRLRARLGGHYHRGLIKAGGVLGSGAVVTLLAGGAPFFVGCMIVGFIFSPAFAMGGVEIVRAANFGRALAKNCCDELISLPQDRG